jgi:hypothetical protein
VYAKFVGYLAAGEAFLVEFGDALFLVVLFAGQGAAQVVLFVRAAVESVLQKVELFYLAAKANVGLAVFFARVALFDLFEVAGIGFGKALADGKGAVGKVDEHFTSLQSVDGERLTGVALGSMGKHQYAEVVFCFDGLLGFYEGQGILCLLGAARATRVF